MSVTFPIRIIALMLALHVLSSSITAVAAQPDDDEVDTHAPPDSTRTVKRAFDAKEIKELKSSPSLQYQEPPTVAESLWDRFLSWLRQFFDSLFESTITTQWGKLLVYLAGIAVLVVIIMMILKVNALKMIYSPRGSRPLRHNVLDENIHAMDFEKLIQEGIERKDFRLCVRLIFLYALKILSDKDLIHFDPGKTNHDYLRELGTAEIESGFGALNFYFEHSWYGNFEIGPATYAKVQSIFEDWKREIN